MAIAARAVQAAVPAVNPAAPKARIAKAAQAAGPVAVAATAQVVSNLITVPASVGGFVSLSPESFSAGGLIDDIDVTITDSAATEWDYNGHGPMSPALCWELTDAAGTQHYQYWSVGDAADWKSHESGEGFVPVSGKTGFNNSTNIGMLLASLVKANFPSEYLTGNVKVFVGMQCHVKREIVKRQGLVRVGKNANQDAGVLLVTSIHKLPDGIVGIAVNPPTPAPAPARPAPAAQTAHGVNGAATGAAAAPPATTADGDLDAEIQGYLIEALTSETPDAEIVTMKENGAVIEKRNIAKTVFRGASKAGKVQSERNKVMIRAGQQEFLNGLGAVGINYTGTEISLAG